MSEQFYKQDGKLFFRLSDGTVLQIRQVSPFTLDAIIKEIPAPEAPMQDIIDQATGKVIMRERNESHPDYKKALEEYRRKQLEAQNKAALLLGVCELPLDVQAVKEHRDLVRRLTGVELDPNDYWVYLTQIVIKSGEDLSNLGSAIMSQSQPSEVEVEKAVATFRGDVQG